MRKPVEIPIKVVEVVTDKMDGIRKSPYIAYGEWYTILAECTDPMGSVLRLRDIIVIPTESFTLIINRVYEEDGKIFFRATTTNHLINLEPVLMATESIAIFGSHVSQHDESEIY